MGADAAKLHAVACEIVEKSLRMQDGSIATMFECFKGNGKVTYSHKQHTKTEARYTRICLPAHNANKVVSTKIVQWVAKSMRPFKIVNSRGFQSLMKIGRLGYYIPLPETVSQDTKKVFARSRKRIVKIL